MQVALPPPPPLRILPKENAQVPSFDTLTAAVCGFVFLVVSVYRKVSDVLTF